MYKQPNKSSMSLKAMASLWVMAFVIVVDDVATTATIFPSAREKVMDVVAVTSTRLPADLTIDIVDVAVAVDVRSDESVSKNTRSPTFTIKSCALPSAPPPPMEPAN